MSPPLVSVVMPAYNMEKYLAEAVQSVLGQSWRELELVLVDDGSTDATPVMADQIAASDPRVRVVHKPNGGLSSARNAGIAAARGEHLCFLDADDAFLPDKIARQVELLRLFPACDLVFSDYYLGRPGLTPTFMSCRQPPPMPMREVFVYMNWFGPPLSVLLRRRLQERVGLFDEGLRASEDWDFWLRASRCGEFSYVPGPVGVYRQHENQMIRNRGNMRANQEKVIGKNFEPGSRDWRAARASRTFTDAQWHFGQRNYSRTLVELVRCAWQARSRRTLKEIHGLLAG